MEITRQKKWRDKNKIKLWKDQKERNIVIKKEVLTHYGNGELKCVQCGENRLGCLTIDHINGGGNKHRIKVCKSHGSTAFYRWLKKESYPLGFQTLCMNCQFLKKFGDQLNK